MIVTDNQVLKVNLIQENFPKELLIQVKERLLELDIETEIVADQSEATNSKTVVFDFQESQKSQQLSVDDCIEQIIQKIPFDFDELPLLIEGESKIVKLLNSKIVVEQFKPTVYSYTHNRYGIVEKTDDLRVKFTSEVFRRMRKNATETGKELKNAFLACIEHPQGLLLVQQRVNTSNLEVRVKRYHVGSPVHRYRYTEQYHTLQKGHSPLKKWSRFDRPIVCFDWRNPLTDENDVRLADEPISDDYASIWIKDVAKAKKLASETFEWLESLFAKSNLVLVDICFFIDEDGTSVFGEISPDCMRVRSGIHPDDTSYDKDLWRKGEKESTVAQKYEELYQLIFNN
ncbi:phosphoribosylaminoimidazolesuccinocarboxamide synthase [Aquimarina sp. I32.4]|uniref:phosphoribosylaminoimidazolesuccinocarboxamide synthase n=1 Tax=Aquimarina sp. I32.4 TaxID=2053903 RepID=UPI000CDEF7DA|nr:phosphoribosylaminoimidazolesuccinocarboxamide synthase [Aquimarina sp. I32.4]